MGEESADDDAGTAQYLARVHFDTVRMTTLCEILDRARWGTLDAQWRSELEPPNRPPGVHTLYTDGDWLAIEELRQLPTAKWEPAQSVSWRESLEDWYLDSGDVFDALTDLEVRSQASMRRSARKSRRNRVALARILRTQQQPGSPPSPGFAAADTFERTVDNASASMDLMRRKRRDFLEAQYRAGLVAGGEHLDHDWMEWFVERVRSWPSDIAIEATLKVVSATGFRQRLETLPSYWRQ